MSITFPWPPAILSPNARSHYMVKAKAAKKYRLACYFLARKAGLSVPEGRLLLVLEFVPPDRRHRDDDNLVASFKSGRDGLAQALGIDDHSFVTQCSISPEIVRGGEVRVTIKEHMPCA